MTSFW